ncbi:MAG: hypothetical protein WC942_03035 [Clostridia bacterium]|jgi:hypothetical protein
MVNLRILNINAADSRTVKVKFSNDLADDIGISNILLQSETPNIPNIEITSVEVANDILIINTLPHTPFAKYKAVFRSTNTIRFRSKDEKQFLIEDDRSNIIKFLGAENDYNPTRSALVGYLGGQQSVYDLSRESFVRFILNQTSDLINKSQWDIRQAKSSNYLELLIKDERKTRRFGPWDRLDNEGAFEVTRVGLTPTDENLEGTIEFNYFPSDPISLKREIIENEELVLGIGNGTYNDLILTLNRHPVIKLLSIQINYDGGGSFTYDINQYGYQIQDPKYDKAFARRFITLEDNQIKLNDVIKESSSFIQPGGNDTITVSYEFKSLGKIINTESVEVIEIVDVVRESAPAITTMFSLKNAPVITSSNKIPELGGVEFLDPYSTTPFLTIHRAFINEIPYREGGLPRRPGDYAIDYETGRVFVYGAETNDGTGYLPPAMNYIYRKIYIPNLDYTYVSEFSDVIASPLRELINKPANIQFNYEQTLVPNIDYVANVHVESRNERVDNRLASLDSIYTRHSPITDVFRIYNETTGEIYNLRRFSDNRIFFNSRVPPRIEDATQERASFNMILNESLILENEFVNSLSTRIFKIRLLNQNIISATEDVIGSSFNSSASFSQTDIFSKELYFDSQELSESINTNRLSVGQFQIDYRQGIVYVGVSATQNLNLGTISYRRCILEPKNSHVISVSKIYTSINNNYGSSEVLDYISFDEGAITPIPSLIDFSDERYIRKDTTNPYIYNNGNIELTHDIKTVRGIYDAYDLNNNEDPINFAESATWNANIITLDQVGIVHNIQTTIGSGLEIIVPSISPGIVLGTVQNIIRVSDGYSLVDGYNTFTENTITLGAGSGAIVGDVVNVFYTVVLNAASTPIVDYNRGDLFIDYSYLLDNILISYEYGDNVIDFRQSNILQENDIYYVTYYVGALRNSLLENFGSLVQVDELQVMDEELDREIYRDILQGTLQTFTKGPTIPAIKQLISSITQINPRIREATFWSLAVSYLNKLSSEILGEPYLTVGKYDQGLAVKNIGNGVTLPISNNLRLEEGTLQMWVVPEWDGVDNDATLTFSIKKDGYELTAENIYIGSTSFHPEIINGQFTINRTDDTSPHGLPVSIFTETGIFIYYDADNKQWKLLAKDEPTGSVYTGTVISSGSFYDVKFLPNLGEISDILQSSTKTISFEFHLDAYDLASSDGYGETDGYITGYSFDGIQFQSDAERYFFDFGTNETQNRFSLYKDGSGYLVFEIWDRGGFNKIQPERRSVYQVSANIKNWIAGEQHNIAISWILNSSDRRDEMHLYVDGLETPNLARYGNIPDVDSAEVFRTIVPEQIIGIVTDNSRTGNDLITIQGSNIVNSPSMDFDAEGIIAGNTLEFLEQGFGALYTITNVLGGQLTLNTVMPATLSNARFTINPVECIVNTEIDIYKNIGVFVVSGTDEIEIPGNRAELPSYSIERNALNQKILKLLGNVDAGDTILIKTFGLNHRRCRENAYIWSPGALLRTALPPPISLDDVSIKTIILKLTTAGPDNSSLIGEKTLTEFYNFSQPSTYMNGECGDFENPGSNEGRYLSVRIGGDNIDFTYPVTVTFTGSSTGGISETLVFNSSGIQETTYKWQSINMLEVECVPIDVNKTYLSIEIKEKHSMTIPESQNHYPVIKYAWRNQAGGSLEGDGSDIVTDALGYFPASQVGNLLEITSPPAVVGTYTIIERIDNNTIRLDSAVGTPFTEGVYGSYQISISRSGFQNGFFFLEAAGAASTPYNLPPGWYEFDFSTYLEIPFSPLDQTGIIGNNILLSKPANAVIDEFRILNKQLTDTRIGETISAGTESITTGSVRFSPFIKNQDTLTLYHFEELPLINDSDVYKFANKEYIQSADSINNKFGHSIVIKDKGLVFNNNGRLNTSNEGLIEFWVSPRYDTYNDPVERMYFDAASNIIEEVTSVTKGSVQLSRSARKILYVRLVNDTTLTGTEYFNGGRILNDGITLQLNKPLPFQGTPVKVAYIPTGVQGDRISIYKDKEGMVRFRVIANGVEYTMTTPIFWPRDTWHRIRASFKFNRADHRDELRLFIDGEERSLLLFGTEGVLFGQGVIFGQAAIGSVGNQPLVADINFRDTIQQFSIGEDFGGNLGAQARFDNFKISNRSIDPLLIAGQPRDVYWNSNNEFIFPSIEDAFTTFLFNFDKTVEKTEDFAIIRDPAFGIFNFDIDIIDSFGIVTEDVRVRTVLEALINTLKPAVSKVGLKYIK